MSSVTSDNSHVNSGLEGVVAAATKTSLVDGKNGRLVYRGYDIDDLADHSTYEEVAYLVWYGKLPTAKQLAELEHSLAIQREVPKEIERLIGEAPDTAHPMDVLRTAVSALGMYDPDARDNSLEANLRKAIRLTAQVPTVVAFFERLRSGKQVVHPKQSGNLAQNFLYMLFGTEPDPEVARIFDVCLILHTEHGLNASTFSARVTASTLSDMHSAITSAIGTLKGPLHGGANEQVMDTLLEIGEADRAQDVINQKLKNRERVMGFGHRVYKTEDPRATILRRHSEALGRQTDQLKWYEISREVEKTMREDKPDLYPNVDFYSASVYYMMGIPIDQFTPIFAISRMAGWTAQLLEQYANNRLIRPESEYVGPPSLKYVPIDKR
ncbi:MAG: citrate synthase [Chloroflexi bacterium]|nr:MAG: citrate synthase [Chloroflexota bacterium]